MDNHLDMLHRIPSSHQGNLQHARFLYQDPPIEKDASISIWRLFLALLCPISIVFLSWHLNLDISRKIVISVLRTIVQLLLAGYVLLSFIFSMNSPVYVLLYLLLMMLIAAVEATSRQIRTYQGHFLDSLIAVFLGGGVIGAFGAIVVFSPDPWWQPNVMVPTAGMLIGNSISGPAVAVDRLLADVAEKKHECETRLAFGANGTEAILPAMKSAVLAALIPNLNMMSVVGLVSIPGMMTGQLLGGATPLVAAEYQMAILWLICATTTISTYVGASLAMSHAVFDREHRLTTDRITMRKEGKVTIEVALYLSLKSLALSVVSLFNRVVSCCTLNRTVDRDPPDYALVSASTHGLMDGEGEGTGGKGGVLDGEEDITIILSPTSLYSPTPKDAISSAPKSSFAILSVEDGKVMYTFVPNNPTAHSDIDRAVPTATPFFRAEGLNVLSGESPLFASEGLSLSLKSGERVSVEGPSGLGKTRLLRAIAELDRPLGGTMTLSAMEGEASAMESTQDPGLKITSWRRRVIYVPQAVPPLAGCPSDLLKEACQYSVRVNSPAAKRTIAELDSKCREMEVSLGLSSGKLSDSWNSLSGGERQRAAIGCALLLAATIRDGDCEGSEGELLTPPSALLLLDEPTAACDASACEAVERAVIESGLAVLIITHDNAQAQRFTHKRLIMTALR